MRSARAAISTMSGAVTTPPSPAERSEEDKCRRLASRAGARRSLNMGRGGTGVFLTGVQVRTHPHGYVCQWYTGVHSLTVVHRGTQGYTGVLYIGVHRGTQGHTGVHRGTQGYTGVHRGTQGSTGVHRGTAQSDSTVQYTWVHMGTQGYTGVHRGTQGYTGVHRGTQGYTRGAAKRTGRNPCRPEGEA
jgi:hypothetical protein